MPTELKVAKRQITQGDKEKFLKEFKELLDSPTCSQIIYVADDSEKGMVWEALRGTARLFVVGLLEWAKMSVYRKAYLEETEETEDPNAS